MDFFGGISPEGVPDGTSLFFFCGWNRLGGIC